MAEESAKGGIVYNIDTVILHRDTVLPKDQIDKLFNSLKPKLQVHDEIILETDDFLIEALSRIRTAHEALIMNNHDQSIIDGLEDFDKRLEAFLYGNRKG